MILTSLYNTGIAVVLAKFFSFHKPIVIGGLHNSIVEKIKNSILVKEKLFLSLSIRFLFSRCNAFIPVSYYLASELKSFARIPGNRIFPILNPSFYPELISLSKETVFHPWLIHPSLRTYRTIVCVLAW